MSDKVLNTLVVPLPGFWLLLYADLVFWLLNSETYSEAYCIYSEIYFIYTDIHCVKRSVSLRIQSECEKVRTRITPNTDTIYAVIVKHLWRSLFTKFVNCFSQLTIFSKKLHQRCITGFYIRPIHTSHTLHTVTNYVLVSWVITLSMPIYCFIVEVRFLFRTLSGCI